MGPLGSAKVGPLVRSAALASVFAFLLPSRLNAQRFSSQQTADRLCALFDGSPRVDADAFGTGGTFSTWMQGLDARVLGQSTATGERGAELLQSLHHKAKQGHRELSYSEARFQMFSRLDNVEVGGVRGVVSAYSEVFVPGTSGQGSDYPERGDQNGDDFIDKDGMNAEHIWPQSFFKKRGPMKSDLNQLLPTFIHPNSVRGHLPFGEVARADADYKTLSGAKRGRGLFEPPDSAKGQVARAMFYFYTRYLGYNIIPSGFVEAFWNGKIDLLLRWNREFPPGDHERARNDLVEAVQGNRNPFIDDPSLADRIGAEAFRMRPSRNLYTHSGFSPRSRDERGTFLDAL